MSRQNYIMSIYIRQDPGNTVFLTNSAWYLSIITFFSTHNLPVSTVEKQDLERFFRGLVSVQMPLFLP